MITNPLVTTQRGVKMTVKGIMGFPDTLVDQRRLQGPCDGHIRRKRLFLTL